MTASTSTSLSSWLERRSRWIFWGLLAISLAVRAIYAVQFADSPLREWHRWPDSDMAFFDEWSQDIAKGNWLQRQSHHPLHSWHVELAELYFDRGGSGRVAGVSPEISARNLWNRWYGGVQFHQEPLYPYLLAILRRFSDRPLLVLFGLQLLAGMATNLLLWDISRRCFGPIAGVLAGLLAALSPTLLYVDLVLLRESFITCAGLGLVWLTLSACSSRSPRKWAILGLAAGAALLLKATLAIFVAGCACACLVQIRRRPQALLQLASFAAGILAGLAPALIRNVAVEAPVLSLSSVATITFINTNAADSDPIGFPISWEHAPRIMGQTGGSLAPAAIETWRTHTSGSLATLMWQKWTGLWNGFEAPDNLSFSFFQLQTPILRWLPFTFAVLSPLALIGFVLSFICRRSAETDPPLDRQGENEPRADSQPGATSLTPLWPLWLLVGNHLIALLFFTQVGRLRVPLVAALIPFAAFAVWQLHEWLWSSRIKGAAILLALGFATAWTLASTPPEILQFRVADFEMANQLFYNSRIAAAEQAGDWSLAATHLQRTIDSEPPPVRRLRADTVPQFERELELAHFFAKSHARYATALERCGRIQDAGAQRLRSTELSRMAARSLR